VRTTTADTGNAGNDPQPTPAGSASASPSPPPSNGGGSGGGSGAGLTPKDVASGAVSAPLTAAVAGFVLYVDGNGNGQFDISGDDGASPDQVVGGQHDLVLVYLRDGSQLDLEKLADKPGHVPSRGYNLVLASLDRWVSLSSVDLTLGENDSVLPGGVCELSRGIASGDVALPPSASDIGPNGASGGASGGATTVSDGGTGTLGSTGTTGYSWGSASNPAPSLQHGPYPAKGDPNVWCSTDGRWWRYDSCRSGTVAPPGVCGAYHPLACNDYGAMLGSADPVPAGWPCDATTSLSPPVPVPDGGAPPSDAGH
jgi:hypothetical protein